MPISLGLMSENLVSIKEAVQWAQNYLKKDVSQSNIQYLIQYAKIRKYDNNSETKINLKELKEYYDTNILSKQGGWIKKLGEDLNWNLSFDNLKESDTTKHVHRLHPYKGKFIPQLVEYFLNDHINSFKKEIFFQKGDTIIDPFVGSGTTLVQAQELDINSIGVDVSEFNCLISEVKTNNYNLDLLKKELYDAFEKTRDFSEKNFNDFFDKELRDRVSGFNKTNFPMIEFKRGVYEKNINEKEYSKLRIAEFLEINQEFITNGEIRKNSDLFEESQMTDFLKKWFSKRIRQELFYYIKLIENVKDKTIKDVMKIVLSRTARSCRSTMHANLATLREPQLLPYYCHKHFKICVPIDNILGHLKKNTFDTLKRLKEFSELKKDSKVIILNGDSKKINIFDEIKEKNPELYNILANKKIDGVFTSPPYIGQIDYHEQHAYAYDLFNIKRKDEKEIGPLHAGNGAKAREDYINGISQVFINMNQFLKDDANIFIVANDKYNLYPIIAQKSNLKIIDRFKRPVLNRTERDKQPYAEIIFHMKKDNHLYNASNPA